MNDDLIINLYAERNENAIVKTKENYGVKLSRISFNIVKNTEDVRECENDTYLKAWNSIPPKNHAHIYFHI